jgi:DNA-binding transcriptional MerR regulator
MSYTIKQLAEMADVSTRTLHYYDEIGLLKPSFVKSNGYRFYFESDLLRLQQILFFRELDFSLKEISEILSFPNFNISRALYDQRELIELKRKRLARLIKTIDKTINKINNNKYMKDEELYAGLDKGEAKAYAKEAKARWGNTEAYKESQKRVKAMTKDDMARIQKESDELMGEIVLKMSYGAESGEVQVLIDRHYKNLRNFYEPNLELYQRLAEMYVADERFTAYFDKYAVGLAKFMKEAMLFYCKRQAQK